MTPVLSSTAGRDACLAFLIVWLILGAVAFAAVLAPFLLTEDSVARLAPVCVWKAKLNRECPGCGLTRSFLLIARGRIADAFSMNRAGPPLYAAFTVNGLVLMAWLSRRIVSTSGVGRLRFPLVAGALRAASDKGGTPMFLKREQGDLACKS